MMEAKPGCLIGGRLLAGSPESDARSGLVCLMWPLDLNPMHLEYRWSLMTPFRIKCCCEHSAIWGPGHPLNGTAHMYLRMDAACARSSFFKSLYRDSQIILDWSTEIRCDRLIESDCCDSKRYIRTPFYSIHRSTSGGVLSLLASRAELWGFFYYIFELIGAQVEDASGRQVPINLTLRVGSAADLLVHGGALPWQRDCCWAGGALRSILRLAWLDAHYSA